MVKPKVDVSEKIEVKQSEEFKKGFDDGFHKGIVQGYIKGHTDALEEVSKKSEQNFIIRIIEIISKALKENVFSNIPIQSLLKAIRSLIKSISQLSLPSISFSSPKKELKPVLAKSKF